MGPDSGFSYLAIPDSVDTVGPWLRNQAYKEEASLWLVLTATKDKSKSLLEELV